MTTSSISRKVPVYLEFAEIGHAVVLDDGRIGIRFHQTEAGNRFIQAVLEPELTGLHISYEGAVPQSNLVDHARRELELIGEDADVIAWYLTVIQAFVSYGHSGGSAFATIPIINELLQCKNLTPLTDDPNEWIHHTAEVWGETTGDGIWQNARNGEAFSNDGGETYYLLSEGGNDKNREPLHKSKKRVEPHD